MSFTDAPPMICSDRIPSGIFFDAAGSNALPHNNAKPWRGPLPRYNRENEMNLPGTDQRSQSRPLRQHLDLLEVSADVNVVGTISRTVTTQVFSNNTDRTISEAVYCFPLYDGSTIISCTWRVGLQAPLRAVVKSKEEARAEFDTAVSRKKFAAILEEHTTEIFETTVGSIPPQTTVQVDITYLQELKLDFGRKGILLTIPTSIAPRYGSKCIPRSIADGRGLRLGGRGMKLRVEISEPVPIHKLESRTHPITFEIGSQDSTVPMDDFGDLASVEDTDLEHSPKRAIAMLSDRTALLSQDFELLIMTDESFHGASALMEHSTLHPDSAAMMISFVPRDLLAPKLPSGTAKTEIIFLADRSGSMCSGKMTTLKQSLKCFLEKLPQQNCIFNIAGFGSTYSQMWSRSNPATKQNIRDAEKFISCSIAADMGGTELRSALEHVIVGKSRNKGISTQVVILTDGEIWDTPEAVSYVQHTRSKYNDSIRFFTLGIGHEVSHHLVEGIAREGGGFAELLMVDKSASPEPQVSRIIQGALSAENWKCEITIEAKANGVDPQSPDQRLPVPVSVRAPCPESIHAFSRHTTYALFGAPQIPYDTVIVHAHSSTGHHVNAEIPIKHLKLHNPKIHHLAAKAIVRKYEDQLSKRDYVTELGKKWSITGKWTSFIAVDSSTGIEHAAKFYEADRAELADLGENRKPSKFNLPPWFQGKGTFGAWRPDLLGGLDDDDDDDDDDDGYDDEGGSSSKVRALNTASCSPFDWSSTFYDQDEDDEDPGYGHGGPTSDGKGVPYRAPTLHESSSSGSKSSSSSHSSGGSYRSSVVGLFDESMDPDKCLVLTRRGVPRHLEFGRYFTIIRHGQTPQSSPIIDLKRMRPFHDQTWKLPIRTCSMGAQGLIWSTMKCVNTLEKLLDLAVPLEASKKHSEKPWLANSYAPNTEVDLQAMLEARRSNAEPGLMDTRRISGIVLTTAFLRNRFPSSKHLWEMPVRRANDWLMKALGAGVLKEELDEFARHKLLQSTPVSFSQVGLLQHVSWETRMTLFESSSSSSAPSFDFILGKGSFETVIGKHLLEGDGSFLDAESPNAVEAPLHLRRNSQGDPAGNACLMDNSLHEPLLDAAAGSSHRNSRLFQ